MYTVRFKVHARYTLYYVTTVYNSNYAIWNVTVNLQKLYRICTNMLNWKITDDPSISLFPSSSFRSQVPVPTTPAAIFFPSKVMTTGWNCYRISNVYQYFIFQEISKAMPKLHQTTSFTALHPRLLSNHPSIWATTSNNPQTTKVVWHAFAPINIIHSWILKRRMVFQVLALATVGVTYSTSVFHQPQNCQKAKFPW